MLVNSLLHFLRVTIMPRKKTSIAAVVTDCPILTGDDLEEFYREYDAENDYEIERREASMKRSVQQDKKARQDDWNNLNRDMNTLADRQRVLTADVQELKEAVVRLSSQLSALKRDNHAKEFKWIFILIVVVVLIFIVLARIVV